ncbi:MAG: L-seryl-tRNA(Sec) selenium transferase [Anaerolineae bacterium]|nr:MAG: L-seryl-tRNA(Sec) selenium transferase [Anaerolineae bacterium]
MNDRLDGRRSLPAVEKFLQRGEMKQLSEVYGRQLTLLATREVLDEARRLIRHNNLVITEDDLVRDIEENLIRRTSPSLIPVVNASGVILHTNLGRAPLSREAMEAAVKVACRYSNLEYDLVKGKRGSRLYHAEKILCQLSSAEAALVVNNNAAAVLLVLAGLASRRAVVIARSQLVEIGGGFRIPDVMRQSGAKLVEVGTTNRVHLEDYRSALEQKPAMFFVAHRSNFKIIGFTKEPPLDEIAQVAHQADIPLVVDLGSGALLDTASYGLAHEPMVQEALQAGADLVCFSGDKLLGGPQGGIILGKQVLVEKLRRHPLARAVRADKVALAALSATLLHYLKDEALQKVPIWQMIALSKEEINRRANRWREWLAQCGVQSTVIDGVSTVGGGSLPGETIPTALLAVKPRQAEQFLKQLRQNHPAIIARIEQDRVVFDPRTVFIDEESYLLEAIAALRGQIA